MSPDGSGGQVRKLKTARIYALVRENRFKVHELISEAAAFPDPPKGKFEFVVFTFTAALHYDVRDEIGLPLVFEKKLCPLHAELESKAVRIEGVDLLLNQIPLSYCGRNNGKVGRIDYAIQIVKKIFPPSLTSQERKGLVLLPDFVLVQDNDIVTEMPELESLDFWHH